jgi:hypothetical protein
MSGTHSRDGDGDRDNSYDFERSNSSSLVAEIGRFRELGERSANVSQNQSSPPPPENQVVISRSFVTKLYSYTQKVLMTADLKELCQKIESDKAAFCGVAKLRIFTALLLLDLAIIAQQILVETPIFNQIEELRRFHDRDVALKATETCRRLQTIIDEESQYSSPGVPTPNSTTAFPQVTVHTVAAQPTTTQTTLVRQLPLPSFTVKGALASNLADPSSILRLASTEPVDFDVSTPDRSLFLPPTRQITNPTVSRTVDGVHFQKPHEDRSVSGKRGAAVSTASSVLGQEAQPDTQKWAPEISGLFSSDSFKFTAVPRTKLGGLFGNLEPDPPRAGLSGQSISFQGSGLEATFPTTSREVRTREKFMLWVKTFLGVDEPDMTPIALELESLWGSVTSFADSLSRTGEAITEAKVAIKSNNHQMAELKQERLDDEVHERHSQAALAKLEHQLHDEQAVLRSRERDVETLRNKFIKTVCVLLNSKDTDIAHLIIEKSALEEDLETTKTDLVLQQEHVTCLANELTAVTNKVVGARAIETELRSTVKNLKEQNATNRTQIIQEERLRARANEDAQAKSLQHSKITARVRELERHVATFEQEKMNLTMAKAAVEKTCEDLTAKSQELQGYKDAYPQFQSQLDELQVAHNDVIAERDELQSRLKSMILAENAVAEREPAFSLPHHARNANTSESDHLDGLIDHWTNQLNIKLASVRKKKADIASYDAEIDEAQQRLRDL